jgi:hypothetical protein
MVRAIPAKLVEWIKSPLQHNLKKEQLISSWQTDDYAIGNLDWLIRKLEKLEWLKAAAKMQFGEAHGRTFVG